MISTLILASRVPNMIPDPRRALMQGKAGLDKAVCACHSQGINLECYFTALGPYMKDASPCFPGSWRIKDMWVPSAVWIVVCLFFRDNFLLSFHWAFFLRKISVSQRQTLTLHEWNHDHVITWPPFPANALLTLEAWLTLCCAEGKSFLRSPPSRWIPFWHQTD